MSRTRLWFSLIPVFLTVCYLILALNLDRTRQVVDPVKLMDRDPLADFSENVRPFSTGEALLFYWPEWTFGTLGAVSLVVYAFIAVADNRRQRLTRPADPGPSATPADPAAPATDPPPVGPV